MKFDKIHISLAIIIILVIGFSIYQFENPKIKTIESLKTITVPQIKEIQTVLHVPEYIASNAQRVIKESTPLKSIETSNPQKTIDQIQKENPKMKTIVTQPNDKLVNVYQIKNPPEKSIEGWGIVGAGVVGGGIAYERGRLGIGAGYVNSSPVIYMNYKVVTW